MAAISKPSISTEAQNLHQESIVIDLHIDPIIQQALFGYHLSDAHDPNWQPQKRRWLYSLVKARHKTKKTAFVLALITSIFRQCSKAVTLLEHLGFTPRLFDLKGAGKRFKSS